jgi:hypothetical protein
MMIQVLLETICPLVLVVPALMSFNASAHEKGVKNVPPIETLDICREAKKNTAQSARGTSI